MTKGTRTNWEAHWIAVAFLTMLCLTLVTACGRYNSPLASEVQKAEPSPSPPESVPQTGHSASVDSVAFSPDGKTLASGSEDKTIKLWDVSTGTELRTLKGHSSPVNSVAFSPDGKTLASGSGDPLSVRHIDSTVRVWDVSSGTELRTLIGHSAWVSSVDGTSDTPAEREIRAGYCDYQRKNYAGAQSHFSKALELDPKQKYAPFLIAAMLQRQFKPGDQSPENIAVGRQAIAAYQKAIDNPNSDVAQKENADREIIVLYGEISREEQQRELLSRATSPARSKDKRAETYTILAGQAWNCSFEITDRSENKRTIERNGKTTITYIMPKDSTVFDKARTCATAGLEYANQAIALDANNESAWSYKTNLLRELAKLAEMNGDTERKVAFEKQAAEAQAVAGRLYEAQSKKAEEPAEQQTKKPDLFSVDELTNEQIKSLATEFTYFKSESKISDLVQEMSALELTELVAPVPGTNASEDEETNRRKRAEAARQLKRDWQEFKPDDEEFSVVMPSPVQQSSSPEMKRYETSSEGVAYVIYSLKKRELPDLASKYDQATYESMLLNVTAHATAGFLSNFLRGSDSGAVAEVKLARKEPVSGHQSRQYVITVIDCEKTKYSVLNYYAGNERTYMVLIHGAGENDPRAQRFLRSWRIS